MSKIEAQIKLLQNKKAKISFLNTILASTKDYKNDDFNEIKDDVVKLMSDFIGDTIVRIEDDVEVKTSTGLSDDEVSMLKTLVKKVKTKNSNVQPNIEDRDLQVSRVQPRPIEIDNNSVSAKLDFALANQHFSGRRVKVENNENINIIGEVVGLDAPHILVKVENGPIIKVPPHKVRNI